MPPIALDTILSVFGGVVTICGFIASFVSRSQTRIDTRFGELEERIRSVEDGLAYFRGRIDDPWSVTREHGIEQ